MNVAKQLNTVLNRMVESDIKQHRTSGFHLIDSRKVICGSEHAFRLPIGKSSLDIEKSLDAIQASVGAPVEVIDRGGVVILRVVENDFGLVKPIEDDFKLDGIIIGYNRLQRPIYHSVNAHILVGGASNVGKTDAIRYWLWQLVKNGCEVRIADLKGFSFMKFEILPHVYISKDLHESRDMLIASVSEMMHRKDMILRSRDRDIIRNMRTIVTIVDEGASMSPNQNKGKLKKVAQDCDDCISILGQQAREPKMPVIFCTQRPSHDAINLQFRANCEASIAFRVKDRSNSELIIGREGAERIPANAKGRCIYSYDRDHILQVPFVGTDSDWEKVLEPLKTEVIQGGSSTPSRERIDSTHPSTGSNHTPNRTTQSKFGPAEKSIGYPPGSGARPTRDMGMVRQRKAMEPKQTRAAAAEIYTDEIE